MRRIILVLATAAILAAVVIPTVTTVMQPGGQAVGQTHVAKGKAKGKGKEKNRVALPVEDGYVLFSDAALFASGAGALLVGGGVLVHRIARTESPG